MFQDRLRKDFPILLTTSIHVVKLIIANEIETTKPRQYSEVSCLHVTSERNL